MAEVSVICPDSVPGSPTLSLLVDLTTLTLAPAQSPQGRLFEGEKRYRRNELWFLSAPFGTGLAKGRIITVELHWYDAHGIGKKKLKIKRYSLERPNNAFQLSQRQRASQVMCFVQLGC
jgi:hypothetical protein